MLLMITVQNQTGNQAVDIQVNCENRIKDTLELLCKKGIINIMNIRTLREIYSARNKEFVNIEKTYRQGNIYTGDILEF